MTDKREMNPVRAPNVTQNASNHLIGTGLFEDDKLTTASCGRDQFVQIDSSAFEKKLFDDVRAIHQPLDRGQVGFRRSPNGWLHGGDVVEHTIGISPICIAPSRTSTNPFARSSVKLPIV